MNVDDHRPLTRKFCRRPVQKSADLAAIPALPVNQLRLGEIGGVQSASFAVRPAIDLAGLHIERIHIGS